MTTLKSVALPEITGGGFFSNENSPRGEKDKEAALQKPPSVKVEKRKIRVLPELDMKRDKAILYGNIHSIRKFDTKTGKYENYSFSCDIGELSKFGVGL